MRAADIRASRKAFEDAFKSVIEELQHKCPHANVGHWSGEYTTGLDFPRRICLDCGFEEEGSWWSYNVETVWSRREFDNGETVWSRREFDKPVLGGLIDKTDDRTFVLITFDELRRARV
jgi:hypothetical protein